MANEKKQRQKTAKDIAWDREREKHRKEIAEMQKKCDYWESCEEAALARVSYLTEIIAEQEKDLQDLSEKAGISVQELKDHVERTKQIKAQGDSIKNAANLLNVVAGLGY